MPPSDERKIHDNLQGQYFDERADFFCQPIPKDIQERTRAIVATANLNCNSSVLDVGCGTGVLFQYFKESGVLEENITGCDLSRSMLERAQQHYPHAKYFQGDIIDFPDESGKFNAVFFNACFGNIYDQLAALKKAVSILKPGGQIIISHPLGAQFVKGLHASEPEIVPHLLPNKDTLTGWSRTIKTELTDFVDDDLCYIANLQRST